MSATRLADRTEKIDVGILYVVARGRLSLYDYLTRHFAGEEGVEIILDRRRSERRIGINPTPSERRAGERRRTAGPDNYLDTLGYMITPRRARNWRVSRWSG